VQAGIIAHHLSCLDGGLDVERHAALHQVADLEDLLVNLIPDLKGVTAINEDGGPVLQDDGLPGRSR